jgi:hypothetical protein
MFSFEISQKLKIKFSHSTKQKPHGVLSILFMPIIIRLIKPILEK